MVPLKVEVEKLLDVSSLNSNYKVIFAMKYFTLRSRLMTG